MRPPCVDSDTGRPLSELMHIFTRHIKSSPSNYVVVSESVCVSKLDSMSLSEYMKVSMEYSRTRHQESYKQCLQLVAAAKLIQTRGFCPISYVYSQVFPDSKYSSHAAKRRLLRIPLAAIRCGDLKSRKSQVYLMEILPGCDHLYEKIIGFYQETVHETSAKVAPRMTKGHLKELLSLAQSDRERECIRYAVYKSSGLTPSAARRVYGFEQMSKRESRVEEAIKQAKDICESIDMLAKTKDKAILLSHGITPSSSCSSTDDDEETTDEPSTDPSLNFFVAPEEPAQSEEMIVYSTLPLEDIVRRSKFNMFQVIEEIEVHLQKCLTIVELDDLFRKILLLQECDVYLINQSYRALLANSVESVVDSRKVDMINELIVTDSESEDGEMWTQAATAAAEKRRIVEKQRIIVKRKLRRQRAKRIANSRFLCRKLSNTARGVVKKYPNIGKVIEAYVSERNVGADYWRRTGVLTFDGNRRIKEKVTYERIREHLEQVYKQHFSYGTVVQLCVARNKRRRSAKNYRGVAKVTTRRARKGFTLKFNPDQHWSAALYRGLNWIQYTDGADILNINRDDASGFRLDTLATHSKHAIPVVGETLTTRTDYVNKYASILQTTSYNFTGSETTGEMCAGLVKPAKVFQKTLHSMHLIWTNLHLLQNSNLHF